MSAQQGFGRTAEGGRRSRRSQAEGASHGLSALVLQTTRGGSSSGVLEAATAFMIADNRSCCMLQNIDKLSWDVVCYTNEKRSNHSKNARFMHCRLLFSVVHAMAGTGWHWVAHMDAFLAVVALQGSGPTAEGCRRSRRGQAEGVCHGATPVVEIWFLQF